MKTNYSHHYSALDLKTGASQKEIHSAFRRLAKLYHADQDSSTYAAMRYKEIRAAYDALRQKTRPPETGAAAQSSPPPPPPNTNRTVYGKSWCYIENDREDEDSWNRLPFSLDNLPDILRISFSQIFGIGMAARVLFTVLMLWVTLTWAGWGGIWGVGTISCILLSGLLFRYYFPCLSHFPKSNIVGSLLLTAVLSILYATTMPREYMGELVRSTNDFLSDFFRIFFGIFIALLWLWAPVWFLSLMLVTFFPLIFVSFWWLIL